MALSASGTLLIALSVFYDRRFVVGRMARAGGNDVRGRVAHRPGSVALWRASPELPAALAATRSGAERMRADGPGGFVLFAAESKERDDRLGAP